MAKIRKRTNKRASDVFTDRDEYKEAFWKNVDKILEEEVDERICHVLSFYGIGGVGKSSLQKELIRLINESNKKIITARVDLANGNYATKTNFLSFISFQLREKYKINFPHFDLAYAIYFAKMNPDLQFKEKELPYLKNVEMLGSLLESVDGLGFLGAVKGIVEKTYKAYQKSNLNKTLKEDLKELEALSPDEIENELPTYFSYDLETFCEKSNHLPVIFIDTYEVLWGKQNIYNSNPDNYIQELLEFIPYAMLVICGREKLKWSNGLTNSLYLEQHLIGALSFEDTKSFLVSSGISDSEIHDLIYKSSQGHPFHIDLSIDIFYELTNQNKTPEPRDFSSVQDKILERFLEHLSETETAVIKALSVLSFYDKELYDYCISNFIGNSYIDFFHDIQRFSFIIKEDQKFRIHDLMKLNLQNTIAESNKVKLNNLAKEFFQIKIRDNHESIAYSELELYLTNWLNYSFGSQIEISDHIIKALKKIQFTGSTNFLISFLNQLKNADHELEVELQYMLIDMYHLQGNYEYAVAEIDELMGNKLREDELIKLRIRRIHHQMFYKPVGPLLRESHDLINEINKEKFPNLYFENLFMIGGNLGVLSGNYTEARKWLWRTITWAKKTGDNALLCRSLRKYTDILRNENRTNYALDICEKGLEISERNGLQRYGLYLNCTKADILRELNLFSEAKKLIMTTLAKAVDLGIKGWIAHCKLVLAELYMIEGANQLAFKEIEEAEKIYKNINQKWGIIQVMIFKFRHDFNESQNKNEILDFLRRTGYEFEINYLENHDPEVKGEYKYMFL